MAAHEVKDDEVLFIRVDALQELQERAVHRRLLQFLVYPFGYVSGLGDERDGRVGDADRALVAEPVRLIAGLFRHIQNGNRRVEFLVIIEIGFRQGPFQNGDGVPDAAVGVGKQRKVRVFLHSCQPWRIFYVIRVEGVHEGPRFRLADDNDDRIGVLGRIQLDRLQGGEFAVMVFRIQGGAFHVIVRIDKGADWEGLRENFLAQSADRWENNHQRQQGEDLSVHRRAGQGLLRVVGEEKAAD